MPKRKNSKNKRRKPRKIERVFKATGIIITITLLIVINEYLNLIPLEIMISLEIIFILIFGMSFAGVIAYYIKHKKAPKPNKL